ncbi:unnamed protein product, partial [Heterosigma akashiwo]
DDFENIQPADEEEVNKIEELLREQLPSDPVYTTDLLQFIRGQVHACAVHVGQDQIQDRINNVEPALLKQLGLS